MSQTPPVPLPPEQQSTPAPSSKSGISSVIAVLVFSCLGLGAIGFIGSFGFPAAVLGLLTLVGCVVAFKKGGPQHRVKFALGAVAGFFLMIVGLGNRSETAAQAEVSRAAAVAQQKHVAQTQEKHATASAQLSQLPAAAPISDLATLCLQVQSTGVLPEADRARCADAYLQHGSALLKSGKPSDALLLLQRAESLSAQKEPVAAVLATAKEQVAQENFTAKVAEATQSLGAAKTWAGQKEWETAEKELDAAAAALKPFEGTSFEKAKEWTVLMGQLAQQRKRIQPGLDKIKAQRLAEELLAAARGPKPVNSPWDGSVPEVEVYLKRALHDPDSYEHVESTMPVARGEYWVVRSSFRGKNAFGGKVLNSKLFYIQNGRVVRVSE